MTDPTSPSLIPNRREVLACAALGLVAHGPARSQAAARDAARAQQLARAGLDMSPEELDDAFDMPKAVPHLPQLVQRYGLNSAAVRSRLGEPARFAYGPTEIEALDVYRTARSNAPALVFIHGGVFNRGTARDYAFPAETFVRAGAHFVVPDFARAQDVGGNIGALVDQVRRAVAWVHRNAAAIGADPQRIHVSGHSSGAELAASVLVTDWKRLGLAPGFVKGGMCCSATYDLKAFRHSAMGSRFSFTDESEHALSPMRHIDMLDAPLIVAAGSRETAYFRKQSKAFVDAVRAAGKRADLLVGEGYNHFEVIETMANPYGLLGRAVLSQMGLDAA